MKPNNNQRTAAFKFACSVFVPLALLTALCAQGATFQKAAMESPITYAKQGRDSPASNKSKISFRLTFDKGEVFEVTQLEGEVIRIEKDGSTVGITPYLEADQVKVKVVKEWSVKSQNKTFGDGVLELGIFEIGKEASEVTWGELGINVQLLHFKEVTDVRKKDNALQRHSLGKDNRGSIHPLDYEIYGEVCCITCSNITVCGCSVSGPCGGCSVAGC